MLQYWGWCKYRYREVQKTTFKEAKLCTRAQLDACPMEVICRFINQSWQFMSAYWMGLTVEVARAPGVNRRRSAHKTATHISVGLVIVLFRVDVTCHTSRVTVMRHNVCSI